MPETVNDIIAQLQSITANSRDREALRGSFLTLLEKLDSLFQECDYVPESKQGTVDVPAQLVAEKALWLQMIADGHLSKNLFTPDSLLSCPISDSDVLWAISMGESPDLENAVWAYAIHQVEKGDYALLDSLVSVAPEMLSKNAFELHSVWETEAGFERLVTLVEAGYAPILQQDPNFTYYLPDTKESAESFKSALHASPKRLIPFITIGLSLSQSFTKALQGFLQEWPTWQRPAIQALKTLAKGAHTGTVQVSNQQIASAIKVHSQLDAWTTADTIELIRLSANQYLFDLIHPQHVPDTFYNSLMYHYPSVFSELSPRIGDREFGDLKQETRLRLYSYWMLDSTREPWWPRWLSADKVKGLFISDVVSLGRSSDDVPVIQEAVSLIQAALTIEPPRLQGQQPSCLFPALNRSEYLSVASLLYYARQHGVAASVATWGSLYTQQACIELGDVMAFGNLPRILSASRKCIASVLHQFVSLFEPCAERYVCGDLESPEAAHFASWLNDPWFSQEAYKALGQVGDKARYSAIAMAESSALDRSQRLHLLGMPGSKVLDQGVESIAFRNALSKLVLSNVQDDQDQKACVILAVECNLPVFQLDLPASIYFDPEVIQSVVQLRHETAGRSYISALTDGDLQRLLYDQAMLQQLLPLLSKRVENIPLPELRSLVASKARSSAMETAVRDKNLTFARKGKRGGL